MTWLRSHNHDIKEPHFNLSPPTQISITFQQYYFIHFMSKLTNKHNPLSLGKHTRSPSLGQVKENLLTPMWIEGFVAGAGGSKRWEMGTLWNMQGRSSGTAGEKLGKLRPPARSTPGNALNPKSRPALFLSLLSCDYLSG